MVELETNTYKNVPDKGGSAGYVYFTGGYDCGKKNCPENKVIVKLVEPEPEHAPEPERKVKPDPKQQQATPAVEDAPEAGAAHAVADEAGADSRSVVVYVDPMSTRVYCIFQ
eukprot:894367_1